MASIPFSLIFLAGGTGKRMESPLPKQYLSLNQKPIALHSFEIFSFMPEVIQKIVVCESQYEHYFRGENIFFARPGERRQDSVFNGLALVKGNPLVCIHDSARPFITIPFVRQIVQSAHQWGAVAAGVKVKTTIKICDADQFVCETPDRSFLWDIQTPQVIQSNLLKEGFDLANKNHLTVTDDVSLIEHLGKPVKIVEGSYSNIKITTPEDLIFAEKMIEKR